MDDDLENEYGVAELPVEGDQVANVLLDRLHATLYLEKV